MAPVKAVIQLALMHQPWPIKTGRTLNPVSLFVRFPYSSSRIAHFLFFVKIYDYLRKATLAEFSGPHHLKIMSKDNRGGLMRCPQFSECIQDAFTLITCTFPSSFVFTPISFCEAAIPFKASNISSVNQR